MPRAVKRQRGAMRGQYVQENPPRFIPTGKPYLESIASEGILQTLFLILHLLVDSIQAIFQFPLNFFTIKLGGIGKMRNFALQKANETGKLPE